MIIDTSAIVAILRGEPEADRFQQSIAAAPHGITPSIALRLARFFGVSADFWLNLQVRWDLYGARLADADELGAIMDFHRLRKMA